MTKTCLNPDCGKKFKPGHYGKRQVMCGSEECKTWYKIYRMQAAPIARGVTSEHFSKIKKALEKDPVIHSLIVVARESALRKGEILGLTWDDVTSHTGRISPTVSLRGQWEDGVGFKPTKTRKSRIAYLSTVAIDEIQKLRDLQKSRGLYAPHARIWPMSESGAWKRFVEIQKKLRIRNAETGQPYRFHDLRHAVGVELVTAGRIDLAQKMLGHTKVETTMRYATQTPDDVIRDLEEIRARA